MCRAKNIDEQEKALRRRQQEERDKFRQEQQLLLKQKEEERRSQIQEKARARENYKEKMKAATHIDVSGEDGGEGGGVMAVEANYFNTDPVYFFGVAEPIF